MDPEGNFDPAEKGDDANYVLFYLHPVLMRKKSEEAGHEVYEDVPYILIVSPGQNKTEVRRKALDADKIKYKAQWRDFCANAKEPTTGAPVGHLPGVTPSLAKHFEHYNVRTVEQLAAVSDANLPNLGMDGREWRKKAQAYLDKVSPEVVGLREENKALRAQLDELAAKVAELSKPKRRGRPKKEPEVA